MYQHKAHRIKWAIFSDGKHLGMDAQLPDLPFFRDDVQERIYGAAVVNRGSLPAFKYDLKFGLLFPNLRFLSPSAGRVVFMLYLRVVVNNAKRAEERKHKQSEKKIKKERNQGRKKGRMGGSKEERKGGRKEDRKIGRKEK